ncbi:MFS transporter [Bacillus sp. SM2101]|uniref:MFS transporter n=1 Tax=Bacillus sp. SM2101 TaxID=2805366 RepID=UPI001BDDDD67|nr:MFS transporter [Bacillus sp. SM2101]
MINNTQREKKSIYLNLIKNRTLMLLWSGQSISIIGDAFFDLAVIWVVYSQSQSVLQTAVIGALSHLSTAIFSLVAGTVADRMNRKKVMVYTNVIASLVLFCVATIVLVFGYLPFSVALVSVLLLNILNTFLSPCEASIMPEIVGKEQLATAYGIFSSIGQTAALLGNAVAGVIIAGIGAGWSITIDAVTFMIVALLIGIARIPKNKIYKSNSNKDKSFTFSLITDIKDGWNYIKLFPLIKTILWLYLMINIISFMPPLYPALVDQQLNGNASVFGFIHVVSLIGGITGGLVTGSVVRKLKLKSIVGLLWILAGLCTLGISFSTFVPLTLFLMFGQTFFVSISSIYLSTLQMSIVSQEYRGRVWGIVRTFAIITMPVSTLIAGILGDIIGVPILFTAAGFWIILMGVFAGLNHHLRNAHILEESVHKASSS